MEKTESALESEAFGHLETFLYGVPKANRDAIEHNLKKFVPWFRRNGIKLEYYRLGSSPAMEGMEGIGKALSVNEDEDLWIELQYYRDRKQCEQVFEKMMQDENLKSLGDEFFGLITKGRKVITGGFDGLKV